MAEPGHSLYTVTAEALSAWATLGAAIGTVATAALLTAERVWRPQRLQLAATRYPSQPDKDWVELHLRSETGERVKIERAWATHGVAITGAPDSLISRRDGKDQSGGWSGSCPIRLTQPEGSEDALEFFLYVQDNRSLRHRRIDGLLGRRPTIRLTGYFPFRVRGRRVNIRARLQPGR